MPKTITKITTVTKITEHDENGNRKTITTIETDGDLTPEQVKEVLSPLANSREFWKDFGKWFNF